MLRICRPVPMMLCLMAALFFVQCHKTDNPDPTPVPPHGIDLSGIPYSPEPYTIRKPDLYPDVPVPDSNKMTVAGVQLGRRLFYDPILSADSTLSCSGCHMPQGSFTDNKALSKGIDGLFGHRSAMSLVDAAYSTNGLFWNGRVRTLEQQALKPVTDMLEMHNTWDNVVKRLQTHADYPTYFRKAFGITNSDDITKELVAKAIAQFERILISSGTSKYDQFLKTNNLDLFDDEELDGYLMFFDQGGQYNLPDAQCFHCHGTFNLLSSNNYFNNGLDSVASLDDFVDKGLGEFTGKRSDNGKFRVPTLRNIAMSAPYMHDGRYQTLEQVVAQYSDNGFKVENEDIFIGQVGFPLGNGKYSGLTAYQQHAIVKFLHTLTDTAFVNNPDIQNPFR